MAINIAVAISLIALYGYTASIPPADINIANCKHHLGEYVRITGIVKRTTHNLMFFYLVDDDFKYEVNVYDVYKIPVNPGAKISVAGILQKYKNSYELVVQNRKDIKILRKSYTTTIPLILNNPEKFVGMQVDISGVIKYSKITHLRVSDSTGILNVSCSGYSGPLTAYFLIKYSNGEFVVKNAYANSTYRITNISSVRCKENTTYLIHGHILSFGITGIITDAEYSLRFTEETLYIPHGYTELTGTYVYIPSYGEYILKG